MALDLTKLYRQTSGIVGLHIYHTADAKATVAGANYFNSAVDELNQYDVIHAIYATGGTVLMSTYFVSAINRTTGVVTIKEVDLA